MKSMLDLVERDVLNPSRVSFLRIDGSVDASQRFGIVQVRPACVCALSMLCLCVHGLGLHCMNMWRH